MHACMHAYKEYNARCKCGVINQNESELANIYSLIWANNNIQFPLYLIVFSSTKMSLSQEPKSKYWWVFHQNIALNMKQLKTRFSFYSDSFFLIESQIVLMQMQNKNK